MLVLGIDTATAVGALALARDGDVLGAETIVKAAGRGSAEHSAEIGPALDRLLERCGAELDKLGGIGIGLGPGSYTGLRVGVAFAKGLEFGLRVPLVGVPSFEAVAYACRDAEGMICSVVDAKMGGVYAGLYRVRGETIDVVRAPWVSKEGEFALESEGPVLFAGPDAAVMAKLGGAFEDAEFRQAFPDAAYTALRAGELLATLEAPARFAAIEPYYLRPSFAELTKQQKQSS